MRRIVFFVLGMCLFGLEVAAQRLELYREGMFSYVKVDNSRLPERCRKSASEVSSTIDPATGWVKEHHESSDMNRKVSPAFILAPTDAVGANGSTNLSFYEAADACKAYKGRSGREAGRWRVPTQRELFIVRILREQQGLGTLSQSGFTPFAGYLYWCSTEVSYYPDYAYYVSFKDISSDAFDKVKPSGAAERTVYVRCIRDL